MKAQTEQLIPLPSIITDGWQGYSHFKDPTRQPFDVLNYPSMNCFVPSRDKIVPRLGKTILGQRSTVSDGNIGFGDFSYGSIQAGDIKLEASGGTGSNGSHDQSSVKIDDDHVLNFFSNSLGYNVAQVFTVLADGKLSKISSSLTTIDTDDSEHFNSCAKIDSTHFINFWRGTDGYGYAQVFYVNPSTFAIVKMGTPFKFDGVYADGISCSVIDATHVICFWDNIKDNASYVQTFLINSSTFAVTAISTPVTFDVITNFNSCTKVDANHFINFWGNNSKGYSQIFEVNLGTFIVTAVGSPLTFSNSAAGSFNSCAYLDTTHVINFWGDFTNTYCQIFAVNTGTWAVTAMDTPHLVDSANLPYNSCISLGDGKSFMNFWNDGALKKTQMFICNVSTGVITGLSASYQYTTVTTPYSNNSAVYMSSNKVVNFTYISLYSFSIVFSISGITLSVPCAGNDRILWLSILVNNPGDGDQITSVTYDGVSMTQAFKVALDADNERYFYYLVNPTVNYNDLVIVSDPISGYIKIGASSYFNVVQSNPTILSSEGPTAPVSSISISETPVVDESWIVAAFFGGTSYTDGLVKGTDTIFRGGNTNFQMADSGAPISPAVITALSATFASPTNALAFAAVMAPIGGSPTKENWPIIGHKKRYTNDGGYVMEVRVVRTDDISLRDIIEVLLPNPITKILQWYQVTENANPLEQGTADRYYMDEFFDTNLNPAVSRRNSRLVWVNGTKTIFSWSGGVNPITEIVPGVSIKGTAGKSWISQGFPIFATAGEVKYIIVKGRKYLVDSGWDTDTLLLSNTEGIEVGDIALAWIAPQNTSTVVVQDTVVLAATFPNIDFCRQNKNYMYYGSFSSRQFFQSNNFNRTAIETLIPSIANYFDSLSLPVVPDFTGSTVMSFKIKIDSAVPTFSWSYVYNGVESSAITGQTITPGVKQVLQTPYGSIGIIFNTNLDFLIGNSWTINASPAIGDAQFLGDTATPPAWANFFYDLPRVPGQGYIYNLPANFYTMEPQEEFMYVGDQYGQWGYIETIIGTDVSIETVRYTPLKQTASSKPIYPYMLGHMENYIVFVTENKTLDFIGRQEFLEMPQMGYLSQPVAFDFEACSFENGSIEYLNKLLYITSPRQSTMLVYDNRSDNKYWQPPQTYVENGILSIVGNKLISHSNILNQTFNLFTGKDDDGAEFTVVARTCFSAGSHGRWKSKFSNNSFIEGYVEGNPELIYTVFRAVNDSIGVSHIVKPVVTDNLPDTASIGESPLAFHPLGNDININGSYFQEIYNKFSPILNFYFIALQISCTAKNHSYEILSMGINMVVSPTANNTLFGDRTVI